MATCQAPGVIGSVLGLAGPMSVYCDWVRWKVGSPTSIPVWQCVKLSEQIRPRDTLACCWDVKQAANTPVDALTASPLKQCVQVMACLDAVMTLIWSHPNVKRTERVILTLDSSIQQFWPEHTEVGTKLWGQAAELQRTADSLAATGLGI